MTIFSTIDQAVGEAESVDDAVAIVDRINATYREPVRYCLLDSLQRDHESGRSDLPEQPSANRRAALRHLDRLVRYV